MGEPVAVGAESRNRRLLTLAGAAALVLVSITVLPGLLFGGGGGDDVDDFSFGTPTAPTTTIVEEPPEETFQGFTSKNPFTPLVAVEAPVDASPTGGGDVGGGDTGGGGIVVLPPPGDGGFGGDVGDGDTGGGGDGGAGDQPDPGSADVGGGDDATTTTTAPAPPPRQPDRVSLLEVYRDPSGRVVASVRVNDDTYQVGEGDEFARSYRVVDLDSSRRCGEFLFGDDRFGLCEGDETLK